MPTPTEIAMGWKALVVFGGFVNTWFLAYWGWERNQKQKDKESLTKVLQDHNDKLINLFNKTQEQESKFITENRTREIFKEEISPVKEELSKMVISQERFSKEVNTVMNEIRSIVQSLTQEMAVKNAVEQAIKDQNKQSKG